jgi:predicted nucleotidyltransferase component of viral defense system
MEPLQEQLVRIGLSVAGERGFVLGGGHAVQMHGMGDRPSEDIDLFSPYRGSPVEVADQVVAAYQRHGFSVQVTLRTADLVQMLVINDEGQSCKVDLGVFWQANTPAMLEVGPVLHPDDAVAGKMDALFNRWAPRDFIDVDAILRSGRYAREELVAKASAHNPGFDRAMFAESLSYLRRIPDREFIAYGAADADIEVMRKRFGSWEDELRRNLS